MARYIGRWKLIKVNEAIVLVVGAITLGAIFHQMNAFEVLAELTRHYEAWNLDELFFVLLFLGVGALGLAIRRARDLVLEMRCREAAEVRAVRLARHDPLTGLPNRRVLGEELPRVLEEARRTGREVAVCMIDLDHFKPINDIHGHDTGDMVLVAVAQRLERVCAGEHFVARVGGDEFLAIYSHDPGADAAARFATQIIRVLSAAYHVEGRKLEIGATVGIARCPIDATEADVLLREADVAMYEAKRAGRGVLRFFHADMDAKLRSRAALESELREAIERGDITSYFQPVISLAEQRIIGFEALARWVHPTRGLIAPDDFIPIAEDLGLIDQLTQRILREGCIAARDWHSDTTLSINIAPMQLKDPWLAARLLAVLTETGFPSSRLIVEVTENAIIDDVGQAAEVFRSLQNAGIRIALDDFGKGYSSLSHLRQLRFNHLKIDSSFVRSMESPESQKIVSAVAGLGKALGMPVTAEGVETEAVAAALRELGCEQAQGYLFGMPSTAAGAQRMLDVEELAPAGMRFGSHG